jgi:Ulp1 family protease
VVLQFNDPDDPDSIHFWDSSHGRYPRVAQNINDWLTSEGHGEYDLDYVDHRKDIPRQRDPFNCGQYMMITASYLFRSQKPDYTGYIAPQDEPKFWKMADPKYLWGRKDSNGNYVHPGLDDLIVRFVENKKEDYNRMKKWQTKQMKGFK